MGKLRATNDDERAERRRRILSATVTLLERWSVDDVNVDRIADLAGMAKGTFYLYFRTREELLLEVFDWHHGLWLDALESRLREKDGELTPQETGRLTVSTLLATPLLLKLYGRINVLYCGSVSAEAVHRLWLRQTRRIGSVARVLEHRMSGVTVFAAERWLVRFESFVAGIAPLALPPRSVAEALEDPALSVLDLDLGSELQYVAVTMLLSP